MLLSSTLRVPFGIMIKVGTQIRIRIERWVCRFEVLLNSVKNFLGYKRAYKAVKSATYRQLRSCEK
jgi:hypothetical protein